MNRMTPHQHQELESFGVSISHDPGHLGVGNSSQSTWHPSANVDCSGLSALSSRYQLPGNANVRLRRTAGGR
jgi:hypothetical protein